MESASYLFCQFNHLSLSRTHDSRSHSEVYPLPLSLTLYPPKNMDSSSRWNSLLVWLHRNGMDVGKEALLVESRDFPDTGRGLAVIRDVAPGETLFTIPSNCLLNLDTLADWRRENSATNLNATQTIAAFLTTYKAEERPSQAIRFYEPYMDSLPESFDFHPLTWTMRPDDIHMRQMLAALPSRVSRKLSDVRARFLADFSAAKSSFASLSIVDFLWGWLNVNTRSLYYKCKAANLHEDNITMCPLLDFANHSFSAPNFNTAVHRRHGHPIPSMIAPPEGGLRADEQVFLLYGHHSNETIFTEYGFTDPDAPKEICIDEAIEKLFQDDLNYGAEKQDLLENKGYWGGWTLFSEPSPAHPSYRLIPALRLLQISLKNEELVRRWEKTVAGTLEDISPENTKGLRSALAGVCGRYHVEAVQYLAQQRSGESFPEPWQRNAMMSTRLLWTQQRRVAALVMESINRGIDF